MSHKKPAPVSTGYPIDVVVLRVERLTNTKDGNPRWRIYTSNAGVRLTSPNSHVGYELSASSAGPAVLLIDGDHVIGCSFIEPESTDNAAA